MTAPLIPASPNRRQWLHAAGASSLAMALPSWAQTSAWPSKPLRLVVPFAPGGSSEIVARSVAGEMAKTIGQNVFVDNKPGAAGNIAIQEVANSEDGHTLILGHIGTLAVGSTGAEFDAFIRAEQARWKPVIARAQIKPEGA